MRQLLSHVFRSHDCGSNQAVMNCWLEFMAGKGSSEVIFCIDCLVYQSKLPLSISIVMIVPSNLHVVHYLFALTRTGRFQHI